MKKIISTGLIAGAFVFAVASCNQKNDSVEQAQEVNEQQAENTPMEEQKDELSDFMTKAASGGMMEVELGKLAQQQAMNKQVKDFGSMMVTDHTKANNELKTLASKKNIMLPDSMSQEHMDHVRELRNKKGADFDEAYMDLMVSDHKDDVQMFEDASNNLEDADAKAFASKTLATLRMHLDRAQKIDSTMQNRK